jgi:hypothetical protein
MSNQPTNPALSFRRIMTEAVLLIGVTFCVWAGAKMYRAHVWRAEFNRGRVVIGSLEDCRSQGVNSDEWAVAFPWATYAYYEAFFDPFNTNLAEMRRFNDALEEKLKGEVTFDVFDCIWDELAEATPAGKRCKERFGPQYREALEAIRKKWPSRGRP